MIRKIQKADIDRVADIWLETNIAAHNFISPQYWEDNYKAVKEMFSQAEIYVCENEDEIEGFVGLSDNYIAGIFVAGEAQSGGIGKQLLDYAKKVKGKLQLSVYQKNVQAVRFYQREGFGVRCEDIDEGTGEKEYIMEWGK